MKVLIQIPLKIRSRQKGNSFFMVTYCVLRGITKKSAFNVAGHVETDEKTQTVSTEEEVSLPRGLMNTIIW